MSVADTHHRKRLDPESRRAQLLACSLAVFAENGIARATHSQIATRAGVSVSAVYSYFRTREDLVTATLAEVESYLDRIFDQGQGKGLGPFDALIELGQNFAAGARQEPDIVRVWLDWSTSVGLNVWPKYLLLLGRLETGVKAILTEGQAQGIVPKHLNTKTAARIFTGGGHTVALMQCAAALPDELDLFIEQLTCCAMGLSQPPKA